MIQINSTDIKNSGGLLSAISMKAVEYLRKLLPVNQKLQGISKAIERHIVHTDPHLDEYFSELLLRAAIERNSNEIEFKEETLFSDTDDFLAQELWVNGVVFGIGGTISPGVKPLLIFDEHVKGKGRISSSCCEMVAKYVTNGDLNKIPSSIEKVINEVNCIDAYGKGDTQHLSKILKNVHEVRFLFEKGATPKDDIRDNLTEVWKRTLVDAILVSIIYCFENNIDLLHNPDEKKDILMKSLKGYVNISLHKNEPAFSRTYQWISGVYGDQQKAFDRAFLKDPTDKYILDQHGNKTPQYLLLSRICFALHKCWDEGIATFVMNHLWETELLKQMNFYAVEDEIGDLLTKNNTVNKNTKVGFIAKRTLKAIDIRKEIVDKITRQKKVVNLKAPLWVIYAKPYADYFQAQKVLTNIINENNNGCGLILIENTVIGTKLLSRGSSIFNTNWRALSKQVMGFEPDKWYDPTLDPAKPTFFILNGNKSHQYILRSGLDLESLCSLSEKCFK